MPLITQGQNLFVVDIEYLVPFEDVAPQVDGHVAFLKQGFADKVFLAAGAKVPRTGGVILAVSESREAVEALIRDDPFHSQGVARFTVTEFKPGMAAQGLL